MSPYTSLGSSGDDGRCSDRDRGVRERDFGPPTQSNIGGTGSTHDTYGSPISVDKHSRDIKKTKIDLRKFTSSLNRE